jgi:hypothetical protein
MDFKAGFDMLFFGVIGLIIGIVAGFVAAMSFSLPVLGGIGLAVLGAVVGFIAGAFVAHLKN